MTSVEMKIMDGERHLSEQAIRGRALTAAIIVQADKVLTLARSIRRSKDPEARAEMLVRQGKAGAEGKRLHAELSITLDRIMAAKLMISDGLAAVGLHVKGN